MKPGGGKDHGARRDGDGSRRGQSRGELQRQLAELGVISGAIVGEPTRVLFKLNHQKKKRMMMMKIKAVAPIESHTPLPSFYAKSVFKPRTH